MKINYITNVRIPTTRAQGYAIMKMCEEFAGAGVEVNLYIPNRRDVDKLGEPFAYYNVQRNFNLKTLLNPDLLSRTFKFGKLFYWIDMFFFLQSIKSLSSKSKDGVFYTRDPLVVSSLPADGFICLEVHDIPDRGSLFRRILNKPKLFFVLNNNIKKSLVSMGVLPEKIFISPSGVEISDFDNNTTIDEARRKINLPQDKKIILYTGHLYKWKGADTLAEVATMMPENIFVFVGGMEPELSLFTKNYGKCKNIIIRPFEPRANMPAYLKSADVLVIPSPSKYKISSEYTSPLKMLEYMASSRPIVASDLPSLREVLNEGNCIFAKPDDTESFRQAIEKVLSDKSLAERIAANARKDVEKYSWKNRVVGILEAIRTHKKEL